MRLSWQDWTADSASRRAGSGCVGPFYCNVFPPFPSFSLSSFPCFSSRRENELSLIRAKVLGARASRAALALSRVLSRFQIIVDGKKKKNPFVDFVSWRKLIFKTKNYFVYNWNQSWKIREYLLYDKILYRIFSSNSRKRHKLEVRIFIILKYSLLFRDIFEYLFYLEK